MKEACLVFPHQLFENNPAIKPDRDTWLIEESLFFTQYRFHKQKLVFHRASMMHYADELRNKGYHVFYVEATDSLHDLRKLIPYLQQKNYTSLHLVDPVDDWLQKRITKGCIESGLTQVIYESPNFLNTAETLHAYFNQRKHYFQTDFYIYQRKKRNLLVDNNQQPLGGRWTYDVDNRAKYPAKATPPDYQLPEPNNHVISAIEYVDQFFGTNPGNAGNPFNQQKTHFYPINHKDALLWLHDFLETRFADFGLYEDAMVMYQPILHHSVLSPLINIGLINPQEIIDQAISYAARKHIPLNSLEGFIRQITGWREFIRAVYIREQGKQRTKNYWGFTRKIPPSFWTGNTGILPIDTVIKQVLQSGYAHHIERLMVLGNFMLLCEFDPDEVYRWFMEMFIDAYDWVMVPNVYGMTQFADGGLMTTKPYISGSNYIRKMSNYPAGPWQEVWDALFWRFMHTHRDFFASNPRLGMLLKTFDKMPKEKQDKHLQHATTFLHSLSN
ncbi:MAG: cryptochrome/photolyase family protein [Sediminibacterium sp.]